MEHREHVHSFEGSNYGHGVLAGVQTLGEGARRPEGGPGVGPVRVVETANLSTAAVGAPTGKTRLFVVAVRTGGSEAVPEKLADWKGRVQRCNL